MNERCKRPIPTFAGTKSGDTVQFEFDTSSDGVRIKSVRINDHLVFSSADRPEDVYGDNNESVLKLLRDPPYGSFQCMVEGEVFKVCVSDLLLA